MSKNKIATIVLGIIVVSASVVMPFHLEQICQNYISHPEWSLGASNAVKLASICYSLVISILTLGIILLNTLVKKEKK